MQSIDWKGKVMLRKPVEAQFRKCRWTTLHAAAVWRFQCGVAMVCVDLVVLLSYDHLRKFRKSGPRKLESWASCVVVWDRTFSRFDRTPTCDGHGHSILHASIASRGKRTSCSRVWTLSFCTITGTYSVCTNDRRRTWAVGASDATSTAKI